MSFSKNWVRLKYSRKNQWTLQSSKLPRALSGLKVIHAVSAKYLAYAIGGNNEGSYLQATI